MPPSKERGVVCRRGERGYILLTTGLAAVAVLAMTGLAIDLARIYVAKNETQTFVDAAAIAAALELDGTLDGMNDARTAANDTGNAWNFGHGTFENVTIEFAQTQDGPWEENPLTAVDYRFVRVQAQVNVPITFIRTVAEGATRTVAARAVAGQVQLTSVWQGACPFSPLAHNDSAEDNYGMRRGRIYTLRWPSVIKYGNKNPDKDNVCAGDRVDGVVEMAEMMPSEYRGYIEETSADVIRKSIIYDYQTYTRALQESVEMTGGAKSTIQRALVERIRQDTDQAAATYDDYVMKGKGNGRRIMICPINSGPLRGYQIVQFASFFLLPVSEYQQSGIQPFCAEYIGSGVLGSDRKGAASTPGFYVVRLVR